MARGQFSYPEDASEDELGVLKVREGFFFSAFPGQSLRWVRALDAAGRVTYRLTPYTYPDESLFEITLDDLRDEPDARIKQRIEGGR